MIEMKAMNRSIKRESGVHNPNLMTTIYLKKATTKNKIKAFTNNQQKNNQKRGITYADLYKNR